MDTRTSLLVALAALASSCSQHSFHQVMAEPVNASLAVVLDDEDFTMVEERAYGFLWSDCVEMGNDAMKELRAEGRRLGYDALTDVEWYDAKRKAWVAVPQCKRRWGWLTGLVYTGWWPTATTVRVRAKAVDRADLIDAAGRKRRQLFRPIGVGPVAAGRSAVELRRLADGPIATLGLSLVGDDAGYDLRLGAHVDQNVVVLTEVARSSSGRSASVLGQVFLDNSFYAVAGPQVEERYYPLYGDATRWKERSLSLNIGLGNEWRFGTGWILGAEWLSVSHPLHFVSSDPPARGGSKTYRNDDRFRLVTIRFGRSF